MKRICFLALMLCVLGGTSRSCAAGHRIVLADGRVVQGEHVMVTPEGLVVKTRDQDTFYVWDDLEATVAYRYRSQEVPQNAEGHLELAGFCIERGLVREAFAELDRAERAAPELAERIARLRKEYDASVRSGAHVVVGPGMVPEPETDPAKILQEQRDRGEVTSKLLGVPVVTLESEHFIIHTTFERGDAAGLSAFAEKLYGRLRRALGAGSDEAFTWTGKVVLYAFARRDEFTEFAERAHRFPGRVAGAYFRAVSGQAELVVARNGGRKRFEQDLTHEATHLFLHFYRHPGRVPNWLHEGMAQSFEFEAFRSCQAHVNARKRIARDLAAHKLMKLDDLLGPDRPGSASDLAGYDTAWSFVEYLRKKRRSQLLNYLRELKDGADSGQAAKKAFGVEL